MQYRVHTRTVAVLQLSGGRHLPATFPVGAVISSVDVPAGSEAYFGMTRVVWEGRQYFIFQNDLHQKCEPLRNGLHPAVRKAAPTQGGDTP